MPQVTKQTSKPSSKPISNGSIFDDVVDVTELGETGYQFVIFGESFSGKTTLACSFPKPIYLIRPEEVEDGTVSVRNIPGVKVGNKPITDPDQILEIVEGQRRTNRYKTIVLDGLERMQDLVVKKHMGLQDVPVQNTYGMVPQADWNWINITVKDMMRELLRLTTQGTHIVFTCGEKLFSIKGDSKDSGGIAIPRVMVALTPNTAAYVHGTVNYVVHTFKRLKTIDTETGTKLTNKKEFGVHITEGDLFHTKWRCSREASAKLPEEILNPTFEEFDKIIRRK